MAMTTFVIITQILASYDRTVHTHSFEIVKISIRVHLT